ncbi:ADP-ribosylglycohydrolase family protein [Neisseria weixii]|uniref:ADP-ribosylglycohydrolase family protein n=1 Tax=Neisseria weixii TaxID=1853276 RepID=UPI002FC8E8DB
MIAFLDSEGFEHALRLVVSLGGDSDTLAAITGSIAEAYYQRLPSEIVEKALVKLPDEMKEVLFKIKK